VDFFEISSLAQLGLSRLRTKIIPANFGVMDVTSANYSAVRTRAPLVEKLRGNTIDHRPIIATFQP